MNLENICYFLRIHSLKENSYGQHGELQQAEIACIRVAAMTFYLFSSHKLAIFHHYSIATRENKELTKVLRNLRRANIFSPADIYEKILCKMKYKEATGRFVTNSKIQVSKRTLFNQMSVSC